MLKRALTAVGKSLLIVTGVGYGVVKALDVLAEESQHPAQDETQEAPPAPNPVENKPKTVLDDRLTRIEKQLEILAALQEKPVAPARPVTNFVTHAELNATLEQYSSRFEDDIDRRFEIQDRSVQSLRIMIARTDELLEQVIENLESARLTA